MIFRKSIESDLLILGGWIDSQQNAIYWGGPHIRYPIRLEFLKQDIEWDTTSSYSLDDKKSLVGFTQVSDSYNCKHISRVIVDPNRRNIGLGEYLVEKLIELAADAHIDSSLFVHVENKAAYRFYLRIGFEISPMPANKSNSDSVIFMKRSYLI